MARQVLEGLLRVPTVRDGMRGGQGELALFGLLVADALDRDVEHRRLARRLGDPHGAAGDRRKQTQRGKGRGVVGMGVHYTVDFRHVPIDV